MAAKCLRAAYPAIIQDSSMQAVTSCTVASGRLFSMPARQTCKLSVTVIRRISDASAMHIRTASAPNANHIRCKVGTTATRVRRSDPGDRRSGRLPSRFIRTDQSGQFDDERPSDVT